MEWKEMAKMAEKELLQARQNLVNGKKNGVPAEDLDALKRKVQYREAVLEAIHGFGGDPLTLEQLRGMDGKPVWIFRLEDRNGWWAIIRHGKGVVNTDYGGYFNISDYGVTWIAYAYPPSHIDREAWGLCDYCSWAVYVDGKIVAHDLVHEEKIEIEGDFDYCPVCGRPLTEEAWAELEKRLRR